LGFGFEVRASGIPGKDNGSCCVSFLGASITYLLRAFGGLDPRRFGKCSGGVLVSSVHDRGEAAAVASSFPPFTRKERLQREFPRCEHYLLRAFEWLKGWTLADSEAAAVAGTERLRNRCKVRPAGKRYGEGEGRPAAIAHGDFPGKLAVGAAAGRGRRRRRRRRRRRSWRRGLRRRGAGTAGTAETAGGGCDQRATGNKPRRNTTAIGRLGEYL
jgi:hypothetical protein